MKLTGDTGAELCSLFLGLEEIQRYAHQQGRENSNKALQHVADLNLLLRTRNEKPKLRLRV